MKGVACGCFATAAWDQNGQLYTWGRGGCGQLGHGTYDSVALPRPVESLVGVHVSQVAFGGIQSHEGHTGFMLVCSSSGAAFSCGSPVRGRLGRPFTICDSNRDDEYRGEYRREPVHHALPGQIIGDLSHGKRGKPVPIARIAAADGHAALISDSGDLYVWGADEAGVLGQATTESDATPAWQNESLLEPTIVRNFPRLKDVVCTAYTTTVLSVSGQVLLIGGDVEATASKEPRIADFPHGASAIFGGGFHVGVLLPKAAPVPYTPSAFSGFEHLLDSVQPEIARILLSDIGGTDAHQLRHELRLLRQLLRAEQSKLAHIVGSHNTPSTSMRGHAPSSGTYSIVD